VPDSPVRVLVYSDNARTREQVMLALGKRIHPELPELSYLEVATAAVVIQQMDKGGIDLAILDGEATPVGGMGIAKQLKEYMTNPSVTVIVVEALAATAYVMGEVNHPGAVTLQGGPLTVIQALALAGGVKDFADTKNIRILRRSSTTMQTIPFNYKDAIRGAAPVYLRPGDNSITVSGADVQFKFNNAWVPV